MVVLPIFPSAGQIEGELASDVVDVVADISLDAEVVEFDQAVIS